MEEQHILTGALFTICLTFGSFMYNGVKERMNRMEDTVHLRIDKLEKKIDKFFIELRK